MRKKTRSVLLVIRRGCANQATWARGAYARFRNNKVADEHDDPRIQRRCASGWGYFASIRHGEKARRDAIVLLNEACLKLYGGDLLDVNDKRNRNGRRLIVEACDHVLSRTI